MAIDTGTKVSISFAAYDARTIGLNSESVRVALANRTWTVNFTDGTGAAQVQKVYSATRTLGASSEDIDLAGVLSDAFGNLITATEIKGWGIWNTSTHTLTIGGTGGTNWTTCLNGTVTLPTGAMMAFAASDATGWTVTAASADLLHVAGTTSDTYEVFFFLD